MKRIGMFAKFWQPGQVKTRLSDNDGISAVQASQIYRLLLEYLIDSLGNAGSIRDLVFTPEASKPAFGMLAGDNWNLVPQTTGDLGQRISHYFQDCFSNTGNSRDPLESGQESNGGPAGGPAGETLKVLVIGGDCPLVNQAVLDEAFGLLDQSAAVIGPSSDGGYYLIGLRQPASGIFQEIDWSTSLVFAQTIDRLQQQRLEYAVLPQLTDIDRPEDLLDLLRNLGQSGVPGQIRLRSRIENILGQDK